MDGETKVDLNLSDLKSLDDEEKFQGIGIESEDDEEEDWMDEGDSSDNSEVFYGEEVDEVEEVEDFEDGTEVSENEVNKDLEEIEKYGKSFISSTGEFVVMDDIDSEDAFKLEYVDIEKIVIVDRIRKSRNVEGLVRSIRSTGLLAPIIVAPTVTEGVYVLLKGFRRLLACARAGKKRIPCIINMKVNTVEIPILEALYSRSQRYTIQEMIDYIKYLENQKDIRSASMIEYLLQMNNGDFTKLKDIMEDNDDEIVPKLLDGLLTIEQAFKKLEQRRRKETQEEKEQRMAEKIYGNEAESGVDRVNGNGEEAKGDELTESQIAEITINPRELREDVSDDDYAKMVEEGNSIEGYQPRKQDYRDRQPLDPKIRKQIIARDNNECQICHMIKGQEYMECFDVHHITEVYLGGDDGEDNLITACLTCHKLVHLYARGELVLRPIFEMEEEEKQKFKNIVRLGNVIRKGLAKKGMNKEDLKKVDKANTIGRTKPGTPQVAG